MLFYFFMLFFFQLTESSGSFLLYIFNVLCLCNIVASSHVNHPFIEMFISSELMRIKTQTCNLCNLHFAPLIQSTKLIYYILDIPKTIIILFFFLNWIYNTGSIQNILASIIILTVLVLLSFIFFFFFYLLRPFY